MTGKIIRGVGGFYYVYCTENERIYQCRARGLFRLDGRKPLVGDDVIFSETVDTDIGNSGQIEELLERKNSLIRPEAANVDQALVLFAVKRPDPSLLLLDRFLIFLSLQNIPVILAFNKIDLEPESIPYLTGIYEGAGHPIRFLSMKTGEGMEELHSMLEKKTTILAGPSGVGKSSLVNCLSGGKRMEVGALSRKTGRGKQTTRHTELLPIGEDSFLLDTPGFSSLYLTGIGKEALGGHYPEFSPCLGKCFYNDCSHRREPDCAVRDAVKQGMIPRERYETYLQLYAECEV